MYISIFSHDFKIHGGREIVPIDPSTPVYPGLTHAKEYYGIFLECQVTTVQYRTAVYARLITVTSTLNADTYYYYYTANCVTLYRALVFN